MSAKNTAKPSPKLGSDMARVRATADKDIQYDDDLPPTDAAFWSDAEVVMPAKKESLSLRLDPDIVAWYRSQGTGYQTRINAVLRLYMQAQQRQKIP